MAKSQGNKIDPKTGDYVVENGNLVTDKSILQPIYIRLKTKKRSWLYAPSDNFGSEFHLIRKSDTTKAPTREINAAEKALDPLLNEGRASDITVEATARVRGQTQVQVDVVEEFGEDEKTTLVPIGE